MATVTPGNYVAEIDTLDAGSVGRCVAWAVREHRQGWSGFGVLDAAPDETITYQEAFRRAIDHGLRPEAPMALGLWVKPPGPSANAGGGSSTPSAAAGGAGSNMANVRTWPSVITEVGAPTRARDRSSGVMVLFCDPIRYLLRIPVWGAYKACSPGELLGAGLSLAAGGDGEPALKPLLPGLPPLRISEKGLRESVHEVPYAIATGEPLGVWLAAIFGCLGVRAELVGRDSGRVDVVLRDKAPTGAPLSMTLLPGSPSATNAAIQSIQQQGPRQLRDTLYDGVSFGDPVRVGDWTPAVGEVVQAEGLDRDGAAYLADFEGQRSDLDLNTLGIVTEQPGFHPGRLVQFSNRSVSGASTWQVARTVHGQTGGRYRNSADLVKAGVSWRPDMPEQGGPITVTGVVDDGKSELGDLVARTRLGRIPVRFGVSFVPPSADDEAADGKTPETPAAAPKSTAAPDSAAAPDQATGPVPKPVELDLSIAEPMAGASHGFVPSHRQGDICRIHVHHPLAAEIAGFVYGFDNRVAKNVLDASAAILADNPADEWSGMVFRPGDDAAEDDEAAVTNWRSGSNDGGTAAGDG